MNIKNKTTTLILVMFCSLASIAQVGIGTSTPNANAALDVVSASQGMLLPRMTTAQRDAIASPAKGLTIFNTDLNFIQTNTGTSTTANWIKWATDPSSNGTAIVSEYTCNTASAGNMSTGFAVSGVTQTITATVTTVGTYSISRTANGVTFAGSGTFAGTGVQNIILTAIGTPTAAGSNSFTLNTSPNCSFSRTTLAPLPGNITLSAITPYFVASVYDQDYLPYTAPTAAASLTTPQAANGVNESFTLNTQGSLTTSGVILKIPYTIVTASVTLPAYTQTINVPASFTEDGIARDVTFSYGGASLGVGSGTINATLQAVGGTLNAKKLDIQTGIGNDYLGYLLAQFSYATNNSGGTANFQFRNIAAVPDRNIADANHVMFYMPVLGADGKTWLNNNLGANYANTTNGAFNPATQASSSNDANAYGSLFQWGRYADGHEFRNSGNTAGPIATPWTSTNFFTNSTAPNDWRTPQDGNLWQGVSGTNNPCPIGYRLPTDGELTSLESAASITNYTNAASSTLKFTSAGRRNYDNGPIVNTESFGEYWTSSVSSTYSKGHYFSSSGKAIFSGQRAYGMGVRCIAAGNPSTDGTAVVSGYTCNTASAGAMVAGNAVSGVSQTITASVTTAGTYIISTTANGVTFAASGTFPGIGARNIILTAAGTPTAATASPYTYTLNTTPSCSFTRAVTDPSSNGTAVVSAYTCSTASVGTMTAGVAVSGVTQTITATVTTVGTYSISTTANGVTFAGSGTFVGTGAQDIVLTATGTPIYGTTDAFTLNTTPNCSFNRTTLGNASSNGSAIVSAYSCSTASAGILKVGTPVSGVTQTITATVTTAGTYSISTTANGVTFAASGTFAGTGAQNIVLTATGTPTAVGTNSFTLNTTPNCSFSRTTTHLTTNGTGVVSAYNCSTASAGTMTRNVAVTGVTQTITATVTTVGTYSISTTTAIGVTFAASGTFAGTGAQTIVLTATGTPITWGTYSFTLNTTPNCSFSRTIN